MTDINTGVTIRGFEVFWAISPHSGPFCYLRSAEMVPAPEAYAPEGRDYAQRLIRTWREADGSTGGMVGRGPWAYAPMDAIGDLTPEEVEAVIAANERLTAGRFPTEKAIAPRKVEVPALAEIVAVCEAEGTPMAFPRSRPDRKCVECGSPIYDDFCTHCHEG